MNFDRTSGALLDRTKRLREIVKAKVPVHTDQYVDALEIIGFIEGFAFTLTSLKDLQPKRADKKPES